MNNKEEKTPRTVGVASKRPWYREYGLELAILIVGVVMMHFIFIWPAFREGSVNREAAGQFGSFVGGYVGPFAALVSVLLLLRMLKMQMRTSQLQSFENRYFELIKMHRDNVAEITIRTASGPIIGRRVFVSLVNELRGALDSVRRVSNAGNYRLTPEQELHIAYYCLFYGTDSNSSRMLKASLLEFDGLFVDALEYELLRPEVQGSVRQQRKLGYKPFQGHQSRLGHYYRHLYQMIRYVDQQIQFETDDKYQYIKTMRAQLSTHEQALLLVNSRTPVGQNWWNKNLVVPYKLVKNIPENFFDRDEIDMRALFPDGYFEFHEGHHTKSGQR